MRPFNSLEDQIKILRSRNLAISDEDKDEAMRILAKENYYNLINGYKKPFLEKDLTGAVCIPERYASGCAFDEIYSLYSMDRDLRGLLLGYLLKFETHFKTSCSYHFSDKYREPYSYLNIANYSQKKEKLSNVLKNISSLSSEISHTKSIYIKHYIDIHDCVPLWVLVNRLTIGTMSYFYNVIDSTLQSSIARDFSVQFKNEYNSKEKVDSGELETIIKMVNLFRNVCAHEEVLFLFSVNGSVTHVFDKYFDLKSITSDQLCKGNLFTLVCFLKLVLPKEEYINFLNQISELFEKYEEKFISVNMNDIIQLSGFPTQWKILIEGSMGY